MVIVSSDFGSYLTGPLNLVVQGKTSIEWKFTLHVGPKIGCGQTPYCVSCYSISIYVKDLATNQLTTLYAVTIISDSGAAKYIPQGLCRP